MKNIFNPFSGTLTPVLNRAREIQYLNSTSGLTATELQAAIDELAQMIADLPNPIVYKGTWDASTNTPALSNSDTGVEGFLYQVTVAGTVDFGAGPITFADGDKVVSNGTEWEKWDLTDSVLEVNGQTGIVSLTTTNIPEGTNLYYTDSRFDTRLATKTTTNLAEGTNLYFTDERAQDAVGGILTNTTTVNLTYDDSANTISANVNDDSITDAKIAAGVDAVKIADGSVSNTEFQYLNGVTSSIQAQLDAKVPGQAGDISPTSFNAPISGTAADITGAVFAGTVRSFVMEMDIIGSTSYQHLTIKGIQKASDWVISQTGLGDSPGISVSITNSGQLQYISNEILDLRFAAKVIPA